MALKLIPDQAIGEVNCSRGDGLGFGSYAEVLANAAIDTRGPFTIGVFGEWGTGKTSLMRLVEGKLSGRENIATVWFNAWRYEQEEHPIVPLVGTIVRELEKRHSSSRKARSFKALTRALKALAYGVSVKPSVKVPGLTGVEATLALKDVADRYEQLTKDTLVDRSLYYGAFTELDAVRLDDDIRVVVLIDDLDRCFPDRGVKLLESIKLALAQPGFIFTLAVAREVIEGYLQHRYVSDYGIADFDGKRYLDKIVQLPFQIPAASDRMPEFCAALLEGQDQDVQQALGAVLPQAADALGGNPRSVVRFLNNILVDAAVSPHFASATGSPVPIQHLAVSRLLHTGWPDLLNQILSAQAAAEQASTWQPADLARIAAQPQPGPAGTIAAALLSDPALRDVLLSESGRDWLRQTRVRAESVRLLRQQRSITTLASPIQTTTYDAYLSYQHRDRPAVTEVMSIFAGKGLRVYSDLELRPGEEWEEALSSGLENSRALCIFFGSETLRSTWVLREIDAAVQRQDKILVIPVILPGGPEINELPPSLRARQCVDARGEGPRISEDKIVALADYLLSLR
jgi:KAP family P-loop domain/TIR domain